MNYSDIKTIILVDDRDSTHKGGGSGSDERQSRYAILFAVLKDKLKELNETYLVLGDGTFKFVFNKKKNELQKIDDDQMFSDNVNAQLIIEKIKSLADGKNTLLLIDYILNNSSKKEEEKKGKLLACEILSSVESLDNVIKLLYSTTDEDKKALKKFNCAYAPNFPIDAPTDAADTILQELEKRGDLCV